MNRLYAVEELVDVDRRECGSSPSCSLASLIDWRLRCGAVAQATVQDDRCKRRGQLPKRMSKNGLEACAKDLRRTTAKLWCGRSSVSRSRCICWSSRSMRARCELGTIVDFREVPESKEGTIADLAKALNAGEVETLVILGGNPVYNAPADLILGAHARKRR